ncbi:YbjN domain-containing protein [Corynebacterium kozikiae]|uniref:YbjN domain-containing protein n=1 Tax=Corynebacterium kozikiae TaxID=2968469 RepID=UPI00211CC9B4|nr:YbjN domain-containing protein [Corynebacterium sp. 76QC2CO]MCQ9342783.1 YbjN domain-containing protein [Corynebacterium sp. 76QC2CO]
MDFMRNLKEVIPASLDTVAEVLDEEMLIYQRTTSEGLEVLVVEFESHTVTFAMDEGTLMANAYWRGTPTWEDHVTVMIHVNDWNATMMYPKMSYVEQASLFPDSPESEAVANNLKISVSRWLDVRAGLSFMQAGAFVVTSIDSFVRSMNWLDEQFPELVQWESGDATGRQEGGEQ